MRKPKAEEQRHAVYLVSTLDLAGSYVGETDSMVVLDMGPSQNHAVRGYDWANVEPVTLKSTEVGE